MNLNGELYKNFKVGDILVSDIYAGIPSTKGRLVKNEAYIITQVHKDRILFSHPDFLDILSAVVEPYKVYRIFSLEKTIKLNRKLKLEKLSKATMSPDYD